ncbi:MAG: SDR family oxidoreductase [Flavobacterium sp.]|jgi:3(or 17)beta-hydroxysteroid dehydrogenase|nr:SDR family oxidoreductase [Flavobacterium sp.]
MGRFDNKTILITGALSGIGLACAKRAVEENAKAIILTDLQEGKAEDTVRLLGKKCRFIKLDVRKEKDWKHVHMYVKDYYGHLDVLINNAGITGVNIDLNQNGLEGTSLEKWRAVHHVNLEGVFLGCKIFMPLMAKSKNASIVNIGSRSALFSRHDRIAYGSSKAALSSLTRSVAMHATLNNYNVRCNIVLPSTIQTSIYENIIENSKDTLSKILEKIPMKRFGSAIEVANGVVFLASDEASYITGTELLIDGGASAQDILRS